MAAAVWLYILTPIQTATLIIAFGLVVQGYAGWKLRHALDWKRLWPFVVGAALGVPLGVAILAAANPNHLRNGVGVVLVLFSIYGLARPAMKPIDSRPPVSIQILMNEIRILAAHGDPRGSARCR